MKRPIILRIDADPRLQYHEGMVFKIPFYQATVVCIDVYWGDGCVDKIREKGDGYAQHTYASPGEYHVRVYPANAKANASLDHLGFEDHPEDNATELWASPLKEIVSLGKVGLQSLSYLFAYNDSNPDLQSMRTSGICDMSGMFYKARVFNRPIGDWDVRNVTTMARMFCFAMSFNQPIGDWDVSNVTNMREMFLCAMKFNQPIEAWDVSKVTDMSSMLVKASVFNQPIGEWNVSNVINMEYMFADAWAFDQPIGRWNVGNVVNMKKMFTNAATFNQPIADWNVANVVNCEGMFDGVSSFKQTMPGSRI